MNLGFTSGEKAEISKILIFGMIIYTAKLPEIRQGMAIELYGMASIHNTHGVE